MNKYNDDLTVREAMNILRISFINLGVEIKRVILNGIERFLFLFKRPKYKVGSNIILWDENYIITSYYKDYDMYIFFYNLKNNDVVPSEGLIDFYNKV